MKQGYPFVILLLAVLMLFGLSFVPFAKLTNGHIKNFSLFRDIMASPGEDEDIATDDKTRIDPELLKAQQDAELLKNDLKEAEGIDTIISPIKPSRQGDMVVIEDYTTNGVGLAHLRKALSENRVARIAFIGDSYTEGDVLSQDLRHLLQEAYGGKGVGYVPLKSIVAGFRNSVSEQTNGWRTVQSKNKDIVKKAYMALPEVYCIPEGAGAVAAFKGTETFPQTGSWDVSRLLFVCPVDATVSIRNNEGDWVQHPVKGSKQVQCITTKGPTEKIQMKCSTTSFIGLGWWFDSEKGISLDNVSSRGYSGVTIANISQDLCHDMAKNIDYDLVIMQYGLNALEPGKTDFSVYASCMVKSINAVRKAYPHADILMLGVGDKGRKSGGVVQSMSNVKNMVSAQRDAARRAHCLFWDIREAMGGNGSVVKWVDNKEINKDYEHPTHKGGARIAKELFRAMQQMLKQ